MCVVWCRHDPMFAWASALLLACIQRSTVAARQTTSSAFQARLCEDRCARKIFSLVFFASSPRVFQESSSFLPLYMMRCRENVQATMTGHTQSLSTLPSQTKYGLRVARRHPFLFVLVRRLALFVLVFAFRSSFFCSRIRVQQWVGRGAVDVFGRVLP